MREALTSQERRLRVLLVAHAVWSALLAMSYIFTGDTEWFGSLPNSFAKDVLFVALSAIGAAGVRRRGWTALVIAAGYLALVVGQIATLVRGGTAPVDLPLAGEVSGTAVLLGWMVIDLALAALFVAWWASAVRAAHGLRYLHPIGFLALASLAEVLVEGEREAVPPEKVARNVDGYLASLQAKGKGRVQLALIALALWPLLTLRPPLPVLTPAARKTFLKRRFVEPIGGRRVLKPLRPLLQIMIRNASQMAYLGYYGDSASWGSIRYVPYRERLPDGRPPAPDDPIAPPLRTLTTMPRERYDTVVVGSGAAGGILAHRFAETGRRVLVVERGPHVDPRQFSDDEVTQYLRLYNEGALQLSTTFSLQVLQGMCVGGGTTINNALCLDPPAEVLEQWRASGVDPDELRAGIMTVRDWLSVTEIRAATTTKAAQRFGQAVQALDLPGHLEVMSANISGACRGTGYCNIGCAYGAKLTTLDCVLPWAQQEHGLDVLADVEVERIVAGNGRARAIQGRAASGEAVTVAADEIVVAAGAIGSSWLLQRSGLGGEAVGEDLHFNINSPLTADFPEVMDSFAGIQMSHAYVPEGGVPGYLVETWFNPPATQALAMPGWFERHFENMRRYCHMACGGVLVGTTTPGRVKPSRSGPQIEYQESDTDRRSVVTGLQTAGRIFLEAGATRVMPATFAYHEYRTPASLDRLPGDIREAGDLLLTSAHPQGGNAMGKVVDDGFRVRGLENLYLCDASVFPTSVHVNPQLTVMGMAQYAAGRILS
jgi:choline dehydrogenase-like flavoprotein